MSHDVDGPPPGAVGQRRGRRRPLRASAVVASPVVEAILGAFCQPRSVAWAAAGGGRATPRTPSSAAGVRCRRPTSQGGCPRRFFASLAASQERREETAAGGEGMRSAAAD